MKKLFFVIFAFCASTSFAQSAANDSVITAKDIAVLHDHDSIMKHYDSVNKIRDSIAISADMDRNTNNLVSFIRERDEKAKKGMWLRIGLGIAMLIVFIIGIKRKRKPKTDSESI
jgi:hypothetical protein